MTPLKVGSTKWIALAISSVAASACIVGHAPRFVDASDRTLSAYCERGDGRACLFLAERLLEGRPETNGVAMTSAAERGCELGQPAACAIAGAGHSFGGAGRVDSSRGSRYFERACEGKSEIGCLSWSLVVLGGVFTLRDPRATLGAIAYLCAMGDGEVYCASQALLELEASPQDPSLLPSTLAALDRACDDGIPNACERSAVFYREGRGVAVDPSRASERCAHAEELRRDGDPAAWLPPLGACPRPH